MATQLNQAQRDATAASLAGECGGTPVAECGQPRGGVRLRDVRHGYRDERGERIPVLEGISLEVSRGEVLALVGPSGCGKTTLLELMCALQSPESGSVECDPAVLMPQRDLLLPWLSALDNAGLALRIAGVPRVRARTRAGALFEELSLQGFERSRPHELSGGMRQRVAFLRTLLSGKPLLCLDEPFGALDAITRAEMQEWLAAALAREPRTVVLVTHDVEEAIVLADRVLVLSPRPARVLAELVVQAPRPRERTDARLTRLREQALQALRASQTPQTPQTPQTRQAPQTPPVPPQARTSSQTPREA